MTVVWVLSGVMLVAAAAVTMLRLLLGPSTLDRLVAVDTLVAVTMCGIGTWAARRARAADALRFGDD